MLPKIEKILYTTTLSPKAAYVFSYAMIQAQQFQASIYVLHVLEPLSSFAQSVVEQYISKEKKEQIEKDNLEWLEDKLKKRIQVFCENETCNLNMQDPVADILIYQGKADEVIIEEAQKIEADLIVMGAHTQTKFIPGYLGGTANKVINHSHIPVLCINTPKDFHNDLKTPVYH